MRRPCVFLILIAFVALLGLSRPTWAQPALVFDMDTGEVLLAEEAGRPWYPASLTKLMTAYLVFEALDSGRLSLDSEVTISRKAANGGGRGAARYGAKPGERMRIGTMLSFLLVRSDADMAVALAEAVAGSENAFVTRMNATARRLGMTASHFVNPHGMHDPAQVTTARDMGLLGMAIYHHFLKKHPDWWRFFSAPYVMKGEHRRRNRNKLLFMMDDANGMKTGFLCTSGFNLLGTARRGGRQIAAVVFGRSTAYTRALFAKVLLEEGFLRLANPARRKGAFIAALRDDPAGAPVNMRARICRGRRLAYAEPRDPVGWAVALGAFRNAVNAAEIIEAERVAFGLPAARIADHEGVARLSPPPRYAGLVWDLDQATALSWCTRAKRHGTECAVYPPGSFRELAARIASESAKLKRREAARQRRLNARPRRKIRHRQRRPKRARVIPAHGG